MNDTSLEPVTVTVPVAIQLSGLGRTKLYELLGGFYYRWYSPLGELRKP